MRPALQILHATRTQPGTFSQALLGESSLQPMATEKRSE
jgi:hypothetical protein